MVKARGRNSNRKAVKQIAKKWHVGAFVMSVACMVTRVIRNVHDQPESL